MTNLEKTYIDLFNKIAATEKVAEVVKEANPWAKRLALGALGLGAGAGGYLLGSRYGGGGSNEEQAQQMGYDAANESQYGYSPQYEPQYEDYDPYAGQNDYSTGYYDDPYGGYY